MNVFGHAYLSEAWRVHRLADDWLFERVAPEEPGHFVKTLFWHTWTGDLAEYRVWGSRSEGGSLGADTAWNIQARDAA